MCPIPTDTTTVCCDRIGGEPRRTRRPTCCPTSDRAWPCSTWAADRAPSPATWPGRVAPGRVVGIDASAVVHRGGPGPGRRRGRPDRSPSRWATSSTSASPTAPSTWSTPTRCSSTWATRWPRWPRCVGSAAPGVSWPSGTATTGHSRYFPDDPELDRAIAAYGRADPGQRGQLGRRPPAAGAGPTGRVHRGGVPSASVWCFATPEDRDWWGDLWADRFTAVRSSPSQLLAHGIATAEDLTRSARAGDGGRRRPTAGSPCSTARCSATA